MGLEERTMPAGDIAPRVGLLPSAPLRKVVRLDDEPVMDMNSTSGHPEDAGQHIELIASYVNGSTDMNVGIYRMEADTYHPRHYHPAGAEFYYFIEGNGLVTVDDDEFEFNAGTAVYLPRGTVHAIRTRSRIQMLYGFDKPDFRECGITWVE
jgi:quercetin dioxygenase-like cupin family protein